MAIFLLDTDILSLYQRNDGKVRAELLGHESDRICICTVTVEEQIGGWSGLARSARTHREHAQAAALLSGIVVSWNRFEIVPLGLSTLQRFDQLVSAKLNVRYNDLRIAAIALEMGAVCVTRNCRDFGRVPGLVIEDWSI